jgi:hypothetical protein
MAEDEIKSFRESLGPTAEQYSDAQLAELRRQMHAMAELLLDVYLDKKSPKRPNESTSP